MGATGCRCSLHGGPVVATLEVETRRPQFVRGEKRKERTDATHARPVRNSILLVASCGDDATTEAAFVIETDPAIPTGSFGFSATGPAVDEGLLCADGDDAWVQTLHADTGLPESAQDPPTVKCCGRTPEFTCADGHGDFVLRADAMVDFAELDDVIATGQMSSEHLLSMTDGTGKHVDVVVEGVRQFTIATPGDVDGGFSDVHTGTLTRG